MSVSLDSFSQDSCEVISLGDFLDVIKSVAKVPEEKISYKKYQGFNFETFSPVDGGIDTANFVEVGRNKRGEIGEVVFYNKKYKMLNYKLVVHGVQKNKILILKKLEEGHYYFSSTAIFMFYRPTAYENYLVDVKPKIGLMYPNHRGAYYDNFPINRLEDVSLFMSLGRDFYPADIVRVSKNKVIMSAYIDYEKKDKRLVKDEQVNFYFTPELNPHMILSEKTCIRDVFDSQRGAELFLPLHPDLHGLTVPLWLFEDSYGYEEQKR